MDNITKKWVDGLGKIKKESEKLTDNPIHITFFKGKNGNAVTNRNNAVEILRENKIYWNTPITNKFDYIKIKEMQNEELIRKMFKIFESKGIEYRIEEN